jgi:hypothetical protein
VGDAGCRSLRLRKTRPGRRPRRLVSTPVGADARSVEPAVAAGQGALARGAWEEARAAFESALAQEETPEALEGLSWAAWWTGDAELLFEARERAYGLYRDRGERGGPARMATWLGTDSVDFRGEFAVASGWLSRARRLLEGAEQSREYGWLCVHEAEGAAAGAPAQRQARTAAGRQGHRPRGEHPHRPEESHAEAEAQGASALSVGGTRPTRCRSVSAARA